MAARESKISRAWGANGPIYVFLTWIALSLGLLVAGTIIAYPCAYSGGESCPTASFALFHGSAQSLIATWSVLMAGVVFFGGIAVVWLASRRVDHKRAALKSAVKGPR